MGTKSTPVKGANMVIILMFSNCRYFVTFNIGKKRDNTALIKESLHKPRDNIVYLIYTNRTEACNFIANQIPKVGISLNHISNE